MTVTLMQRLGNFMQLLGNFMQRLGDLLGLRQSGNIRNKPADAATSSTSLNPESSLLPYAVGELPPSPWLVFAPHADDETYGMGGALLLAKTQGIETHVVVLTDGALGGAAEGLVATRQAEVQHAARELGLASLTLWNEPDRGLTVSAALIDKLSQQIAQSQPASVFFPGPLEAHPDHRLTAQLVWRALQQMQQADEAQAQPLPQALSYEISNQSPINLMLDTTEVIADKARVMSCYNSQNSENNYEDLVLALDKGRTFTMPPEVQHCEGFYRYSAAQRRQSLETVTQELIGLYF